MTNASVAEPFVAISLDIDADILTDVMLEMPNGDGAWACSAAGGQLDGLVGKTFARLVALLENPDDRRMLGLQYVRELCYRLLQSPMGNTLRQVGQQDERRRRIKTAADWLCTHQSEPVIVSELATLVGMSLTSFHRHFKAVTGLSPLAFQRHMRLVEARKLLLSGTNNVSSIAYAVGYASPSQFSREYKALFGNSPVNDYGRENIDYNSSNDSTVSKEPINME